MTLREVKEYYLVIQQQKQERLKEMAIAVQIGAAAALGNKVAGKWLREDHGKRPDRTENQSHN